MKSIKAFVISLASRVLVAAVAVIIVMKPLPVRASTTIEHLQLILNELGFDAGSPDGVSGPRTEGARKNNPLLCLEGLNMTDFYSWTTQGEGGRSI